MTFQIARSQINRLPFDYVAEVERFRQAMLDHRFTLDPAPHAAGVVEAAVRRVPVEGAADDFVIDLEILEDLPPPPTPAQRKAMLAASLQQAEAAALSAVISMARERLLSLDLADADMTRDDAGVLIDARARSLLERQAEINARRLKVNRYFAGLELELEDLADSAVDAWSFKPFAG